MTFDEIPFVTNKLAHMQNRRAFLGRASGGLGALALTSLLNPTLFAPPYQGIASGPENSPAEIDPRLVREGFDGGALKSFHHPPRIKRVIFLYMSGGPSQFETFDNKPELARMHGQPMPESFTKGQPIAQLQGQELKCLGPQFEFQRFGESQQEITTLFPHLGTIADEMCIIRSMQTDQINHDPAHTVMNTGTSISGRPSMGSWITYGLGSETRDLPGFVVLTSFGGRNPQPISTRHWHSGFLPSRYQGVKFNSTGDPVLYAKNPPGVSLEGQRDVVSTVQELNRLRNETLSHPDIETRINQYETAFRMQMSVPGLMDVSDEPKHILDMYGTPGADGTFAGNCLLARRLAERGVRFIQLYHRDWDHHNNIPEFMKICSGLVDQGTAALVKDLKQRGMLDETLIVWGGEFGRTPMAQTSKGPIGRDHHIR